MSTQRREEKRIGECTSAWRGERERDPRPFGSSFYMSFPLPGPALCKLSQPGVSFVLPEVLTPVLRPSFVLFFWAFPFFIFQPPPFWTPVSYSNYLTGRLMKFDYDHRQISNIVPMSNFLKFIICITVLEVTLLLLGTTE